MSLHDQVDDACAFCTSVLPPHRYGAVPSPVGMGQNGRTDLPRGSTKRSPPLSRTVFLLGRPLTGHNWAAPLFLINQTRFRCLLILALLLISGNVHPNLCPISNHPHPRYPCSICHLNVGRNSLQCSACLKWVHFLCSSLTRADFCTICATGTAEGWRCPACHPQSKTGSPSQTSPLVMAPASSSPRVPPTTAWLLSITSTSGPPMLPLLHVLSRGRKGLSKAVLRNLFSLTAHFTTFINSAAHRGRKC